MIDRPPLSIPEDSRWELVDEDHSQLLLTQLKREIGPSHKLFGLLKQATVIAADGASDDRLLEIRGDKRRLFIVHPTWSPVQSDSSHWPRSQEVTEKEAYEVLAGGFWPD